ncbi:unnamed protein product, partial [Staurois parvus]
CSPLRIGTFGEWGGGVPEFDRYPLPLPVRSPRRSKAEGVLLPPCSLLGHMTGPRRLQDHS